MKKKTSIYISEKQCILEKNIIFQHFNKEFERVVDKFNDFNLEFSNKISDDENSEGLTNNDDSFFEEYYTLSSPIKISNHQREIKFYDIKDDEIGNTEWEIISFCSGAESNINNRLRFVIGNIGEGKSTLINYVLKYLYKKRNSLKNSFIPILINCQGYLSKIMAEKKKGKNIDEFIDDIIKTKILDKIRNHITIENDDFWIWYEDNISSSFRSKLLDIRALCLKQKELEIEVRKLRLNEKNTNNDFFIHAIGYVLQKLKKEIVIVFDNVDPFDIDIISEFYWKAKNYINLSPVKIIITVRSDTFRKLQDKIYQTSILRVFKLETNLEQILKRRCEKLLESVKVASEKRQVKIELKDKTINKTINPISQISIIINAILNPNSLNYITKFAKRNIRSELELLRIVFESGFLPNSVLHNTLINEDNKSYVIPPEYILSSIITFGYGTYFTKMSKVLRIPGVINILSNSHHNKSIQIFSKLYILNYLQKKGSDEQKKDTIIERYNNCIKKMNNSGELLDSFKYSFYRLFNAGLISSPDVYSVDNQDSFEAIVKDVRISTLGNFYFETLLTSPFYLFFVKDDVYLDDITKFDDAYYVLKNSPPNKYFWTNFKNLIIFLKTYGEIEINAIESFVEFNSFDYFNQNFGCESDKLFSLMILKELDSFCSAKTNMSRPLITFFDNHQVMNSTDISNLKINIDYLENKYNQTIKQ